MSQQNPPVPAPRRKINLPSLSMDDELLSCSSTPQSQGYSRDSTAPRVLPRSLSTQNDTVYDRQLKVGNIVGRQPPPLPKRTPTNQFNTTETQDDSSVAYQKSTSWSDVSRDLQLKGFPETQTITIKAERLYKAIQEYIKLMSTYGVQLEGLISELKGIADNLNKVSKGAKIAGITGGASTAAGGVAAAAGVILAPFTAGASLALTVVGAGVAAAGGVTGASAAIAHKVNLNQDTKKINKLLQQFKDGYEEILLRLRFINEGIDQLKHHGLPVLKEKLDKNMIQSKNAASAVQLAIGDDSAKVPERSASASGVLDGFALGMDIYFTKDGQEVKKGLESKLAKKLFKIAEQFDLGLKELKKMKDLFS